MGMICCLQPIDASEIDGLLADPATIHEVLEEGNQTGIYLDKSWHAIHFLLSGSAWEGEEPECFLLTGGETIGDEDVGYGPARLLRPTDVSRFNDALQLVDAVELLLRYDPEAMTEERIYPDIWQRKEEREENFQYVAEYFETLRQFVASTAKLGKGIIISVC